MFFVKATYRGETRKLTFPTCSTFPAFNELCEQLCRVFPLSQGFTISRLLFSPTPVNSIRLLVGQKVQSAEDYLRYIEPYQNRLWPDATLRLTVLDGGPLNSPNTKKNASHNSQSNHATFSDHSGITQAPLLDHSISMSYVPPPPILFPSYSAATTPIPNASSLFLQTPNTVSDATVVPGCSTGDDSKKEIQALLDNFMHDLSGLLDNTFLAQDANTPRNTSRQDVDENPLCARCKQGTQSTSYYCAECGANVCGTCVDFVAAARCSPKASLHRLARRAFVSNHEQQPSIPPVPFSPPQPATTQIVNAPGSRRIGGNSQAVHNAVCDLCDSDIRGVRYKCLDCPDFDSCSSCFTITNEQHPNHSFVKIAEPANYIHRHGLRPRHHAVCNVCNNVIHGTRYKCVHPDCPDYDLCEGCESHPIPLHPENHPMLKLKITGMSVDVLQSFITEHPVATSLNEMPQAPFFEPVSLRTSEDEPAKPVDAVAQTESQPQSDSSDWRSAFLPPELQVSKAMSTPTINEMPTIEPKAIQTEETREDSETASILEYTPSEVSEARDTPADSTSVKDALLVDTPDDVAIVDACVPVPSPAPSILRNNLEKEPESHVPFLAMHVENASALSGQTLPPGAEFIKTWRIQNTGIDEWPGTTELVFTGGDSLTQITAPVLIGSVSPGAWVEVSTHLLKAPTVPGNYVSYWSLRALQSGTFGDSLWVNVNVVEQSESSEECLSSSSIMKIPQSVSQERNQEMIEDKTPSPTSPTTSERLTEETLSDVDSQANLSFDGSDWQDFPAEQEEYVILYDDSSSDGE